jgi:hypothetical protein
MAKRKAARRAKKPSRARAKAHRAVARATGKSTANSGARRRSALKKSAPKKRPVLKRQSARRQAKRAGSKRGGAVEAAAVPTKQPRLDRARRTLDETLLTPPSSLDMNRHGSAVSTGRAELQESLQEHTGMTPALTGGDVDADWENAYFSGDEAPGGDNPTPDQDIVEDIGRSLGVEYQDAEELRGSEKVVERDKHRWELDPASSEDYKDRK